jgi:DNA-binding NtrC family response regulator
VGGNAITRTSPGSRASGPRLIRQLVVVCAPGRLARSVIALERAPISVGREGEAPDSLRLPDPEVSRCHARFEPAGAGWAVVDQGSHNGVYVDGRKVERAELRPGGVIRLGACLIVYAAHELEEGLPLVAEWPELLGPSVAMQLVRGAIELAAPRSIPVLVRGETGVGKERVAEALHRRSGRAGRFVPVNCAAIPAGLADSELFGHVPGAFTGAAGSAEGLFAAADRGTLFLDEIGELPEPLQAKLLRALATGEVRPVGATASRRVDVRVIAATHRELEARVASGDFRADLLARLAAWTIRIPPLRDRREDILRIAGSLLERAAPPPPLDVAAAEALVRHDWPANVRELEQVLGRAVVLAAVGRIEPAHLPAALRPGAPTPADEQLAPADLDRPLPLEVRIDRTATPSREVLCEVLAHFDGRVTATADFFGRSRRQLYRWMRRLRIDPGAYRD